MRINIFKSNHSINKRLLDVELDVRLIKKDIENCKYILQSIQTDIKILMERK